MSKFYVVATPIGNLEDITLRALRILKEVDVIVCEDTRVTKHLLTKYDIQNKQLTAYNEQQSGASIEKILYMLKEGKNLALVSDSGTPAISDPGSRLIQRVRDAEFDVIAVPGPSAVIAGLSIAGIPASDFLFLGFLPHKKGRKTLFQEIAASGRTVVFYESPHRILKTLASLVEHMGESRRIIVARELTKIHEEVISGTSREVLHALETNPEKTKGEFVVMVGAVQ